MDRRRLPLLALLPAVLCLVLGLSVTAALFAWTRGQEQELDKLIFERRASFRIQTVRQGMEEVVETLDDVNRVFATFRPVSREQFHAFVAPLSRTRPYFNAIFFARLVSRAERGAYEERMRQSVPDFEIREMSSTGLAPAGVRDNYLVVEYLEPGRLEGLAGTGFDILSTPHLERAVTRAADTGQASGAALLRFEHLPPNLPRLVMVKALYRPGMPQDTAAARRAAAEAYTALGMPAAQLIESALNSSGMGPMTGMDISVHVGDAGADSLVYQMKPTASGDAGAGASVRTMSQSFEVAGVPWRVEVSAANAQTSTQYGSWLVALFGVIISVMAATYLRALVWRTQSIHQLVNERTAALHTANSRLNSDIAARKRVEGTLRRTEHTLKNAQRIAHVGSWEIDVATGFQHWSDECFQIFGLAPEADGVPQLSRLPEATQAMWRGFLRDIIAGGSDGQERSITRPDGTVRHLMLHAEMSEQGDAGGRTITGTVLDISDFKRVETELRRSQHSLRELGGHQERIKENERRRIAREIHDELGGLLTGIKAYVSVASSRVGADAAAAPLLAEAMAQADSALDTVRRVIADLRPSVLDQLGVWEAIDWQASQLEAQTGVNCHCSFEPGLPEIEQDGGAMLFRIVQEALTNVARHAQASSVEIRVMRDGDFLQLKIEDDGPGISPDRLAAPDSWGLRGMRERAHYLGGILEVTHAPGGGTLVSLRLPLPVKIPEVAA